METRKVQLSGGTTYTISLPKSWAREHGIEAGSVLYLYPNEDGSLLVEAGVRQSQEGRTAHFDATGSGDEQLRESIEAMYIVGADEVEIEDRSGGMAERETVVMETLSKLSGLEVMSATDRSIMLRNLIASDQISIRKSCLRLRLITLAMHRDAVEAVLSGDDALAEEVIGRDNEADKLFALVTRHFRRSFDDLQEVERLGSTRSELFEYYYAARQFERIADHTVKMARLTLKQDAPPSDPFDERFSISADRARAIMSKASDVVFSDADVEMAYDALTECDELVSDIDAFDRDLYDHDEAKEAFTIGLLLDSVRRTAEYGRNVAEVAVQGTVRETLE